VRGEEGDAERRAQLEGRFGPEQYGLPGRDDGELGGRPEGALIGRLPDPHPFTDEHRVDALADGVDRAGAVLVGDLAVRPRIGGAPRLPVGRVHPGERDTHADLAVAGLGNRAVDQLEDVGTAGLAVGDGSHDGLLPAPGRATQARASPCSDPYEATKMPTSVRHVHRAIGGER
jgi:hypothetical protein